MDGWTCTHAYVYSYIQWTKSDGKYAFPGLCQQNKIGKTSVITIDHPFHRAEGVCSKFNCSTNKLNMPILSLRLYTVSFIITVRFHESVCKGQAAHEISSQRALVFLNVCIHQSAGSRLFAFNESIYPHTHTYTLDFYTSVLSNPLHFQSPEIHPSLSLSLYLTFSLIVCV